MPTRRAHAGPATLGCLVALAGCAQRAISPLATPAEEAAGWVDEPVALTFSNQEPNLSIVQADDPEPNQLAVAAETLKDPDASPEARATAAGLLLDSAGDGLTLVEEAADAPGALPAVLEAARTQAHRALVVLSLGDPAWREPSFRVALIESLRQARTPAVVRALVPELAADATRPACFETLSALTGRSDLGTDPAAWIAWLDSLSELSDEAWRDRIVSDLVGRVTRLDERATRAERMLADAYRRLYLLSDAAGRPALLSELLRSDQPGLQALGFELAERELAANADLDAAVSEAAIALLDNRDAAVRARAARLVNRLAPPSAAEAVGRVLAAEMNPVAAEALLQAAVRWPSPQLVEPVLRWLGEDRTREAACLAAVSLFDAGLLVGDEARERVRALLTPIPENATPARLILLAQAGNATDREAIAAMLRHSEEATRLAATDALSRSDAGAGLLIDAAAEEPTLAPDALISLARHNRLEPAAGVIDNMDAWMAAFERSTASGVRATLAGRILSHFGSLLSPEQKSVYEAAVDPAG